MPTFSPALVRLTLDIPADLLAAYTQAAESRKVPVEHLIVERLESCRTHDAIRPLYFHDAEREEAEQILGGSVFRAPTDLLHVLRTRYTVPIGMQRLSVDEQVYTHLKDRASEIGIPLSEIIAQACRDGLSDAAFGAH